MGGLRGATRSMLRVTVGTIGCKQAADARRLLDAGHDDQLAWFLEPRGAFEAPELAAADDRDGDRGERVALSRGVDIAGELPPGLGTVRILRNAACWSGK